MIEQTIRKFLKWNRKNKFTHFYKQFIQKGDLCFDIGANEGSRTSTFLNIGAKVIAVEPVDDSYNTLLQKFNTNPDVDLVHAAIGKKVGQGIIYLSNYPEVCTLSELFIEKYKNQKEHDIQWDSSKKTNITTLDKLIEIYGLPQFCKIDVEGYEPEVLKGLSKSIPAISFEYNARLKELALECIEILAKFNSLTYNFSPYETMELTFVTWQNESNFIQFIKELPATIKTGDIYVKQL